MKPAPTFAPDSEEKPISDFRNCHQGIFKKLDDLTELSGLIVAAERARLLAEKSVEFFREAIFEHHLDEERELFPAVLAECQKGDEFSQVKKIVDRLTAEHRELEGIWKRLESDLKKVAKGRDAEVDLAAIEALTTKYRAHAQYEETEFLPLSEKILARNPNGMAALGMSLHMRHAPIRVSGYV